MKQVYLTNRFQKQYLKKFIKYFSKEDFVKQLKIKEHTLIDLHFPYMKLKNKIWNIVIRWIIFIIFDKNIVPIILFLKKDKHFWENINWNTHEKLILKEYKFALENIKKGNFEVL